MIVYSPTLATFSSCSPQLHRSKGERKRKECDYKMERECVKRELERGGATMATSEREREKKKETERRTKELKRGQSRNTRTTSLGDALAAGALEENGEDHLYVLLLKRLALQARVADGDLESFVHLGSPD